MKILLFQHATAEHPGIFRQFLKEDGHQLDTVELDKQDPIPAFDNYDALWVMGGPMDVWQEEENPWLIPEKAAIKTAVIEKGLPFLGVCLGHQLLAEALGGKVGLSKEPEIGVMEVYLTDEGKKSPFFQDAPNTINSLQWHSAEVQTLPEGTSILASSPACTVNAMSYGDKAMSIQFHVEAEHDTVSEWSKIPEYAAALEKTLGENGVQQLEEGCAQNMAEFNKMARLVYDNWCKACYANGTL